MVGRYATVYPLVTTRALARPFTYEVDEGVGQGRRCLDPLGRSRVRGVVVGEESSAPDGVQTVAVTGVVDEVSTALVDLALWVAEYCGSTRHAPLSRRHYGRGEASGASRPSRTR